MLEKIKNLDQKSIERLEADGWTIERLATATINQLTTYQGIGKVLARRLIDEARQLVHQTGLVEAETERISLESVAQPRPVRKVSVRVQRIREKRRGR